MSTKKVTEDQANEAFGLLAKAESSKATINAQIDKKIQEIRDKYAQPLADADDTITVNTVILSSYAEQNKDLFADKKSIELTHGIIGYKTTPDALVLADGVTDDLAINQLRIAGEPYAHLLTLKYTLNKSQIKSAIKGGLPTNPFVKKLVKIGFELKSDEKFFIKVA